MKRTFGKQLKNWASRILFLTVLVAVGWVIAKNINQLNHHRMAFQWQLLLASFGLILLAFLLQVITWRLIASSFDIKAPFIRTAHAWFMSRLGRYVPGKITILLVRMDLYRGQSKRKITAATAIEQISSMASACLLILLTLLLYPEQISHSIRLSALIGAIVFLILLWPGLFIPLINYGFKLIKKDSLQQIPSYSFMLLTVGCYLLTSIIHGASFFLLLNAAVPLEIKLLLPISAAYYSASLIGLFAFFAPSGLGVREGILLATLPFFMPMPVVIFGVLAIRIVTTAGELAMALVFFLLDKTCNKQPT